MPNKPKRKNRKPLKGTTVIETGPNTLAILDLSLRIEQEPLAWKRDLLRDELEQLRTVKCLNTM